MVQKNWQKDFLQCVLPIKYMFIKKRDQMHKESATFVVSAFELFVTVDFVAVKNWSLAEVDHCPADSVRRSGRGQSEQLDPYCYGSHFTLRRNGYPQPIFIQQGCAFRRCDIPIPVVSVCQMRRLITLCEPSFMSQLPVLQPKIADKKESWSSVHTGPGIDKGENK